jgi:lysozyme family protein
MASFDLALPIVLEHEGGIVDNPDDRGGVTMLGLTKGSLSEYLGRDATEADVEAVTEEDARLIYKKLWWDHQCLDLVGSQSIALCLFDQSVVAGKGFTGRMAQLCVGFTGSQVDGGIGPSTIAAINAANENTFLAAFLLHCRAHYDEIVKNDSTQKKFLAGWVNRLEDLAKRVGVRWWS